MKTNFKLAAFFSFFFLNSILFAQNVTTTIDYVKTGTNDPGLPTDGVICNIFNSYNIVQNVKHHPIAGGMRYDGSAIKMPSSYCQTSTCSKDDGSSYAIEYNFKQYYSYKIDVKAFYSSSTIDSKPSINVPTVQLSLFSTLTNLINDKTTVCDAVPSNYYSPGLANSLFLFSPNQDNTYSTGSFNGNPSSMKYVVLTSHLGDYTTYALIKKITINETPPFFLQASSTSITCGSTSPITFTVNKLNEATSGVTTYTWNLGEANGWDYMGSQASPTITTPGNSITLTPRCGEQPKGLSATVTFNGGTFTTNSVPNIIVNPPPITQSSNPTLCSGTQQYSLYGVPCGATVTWSGSDNNIATVSGNGNSANVTQVGNGSFLLTAVVSGLCGSSTNKTFNFSIEVGGPIPIQNVLINSGMVDPNFLCPNTNYSFVIEPTLYQRYEWALPYGWDATNNSGGPSPWVCYDYELDVLTDNSNSGMVGVRSVNECGASDFYWFNTALNCGGYYAYTISPNPAADHLVIDGRTKNKNIKEVQLIDKMGGLKKIFKFKDNRTFTDIDVSYLTPGIYYLKIFDGKKWVTKAIRIK